MKTINQNIYRVALVPLLGVFFILGALTSCDLTRRPTSVLPLEESLETYDDAVAFNRGIMAQFRNRYGGSFSTPQEYMADYLNASANLGNVAGQLHGWKELTPSYGTFSSVYYMYYSTMKNLNYTVEQYQVVQNRIKEALAKTTNEAEKAKRQEEIDDLSLFIGTSYFARAYYYYNLMLRYGMPYNAATAKTDLGVPLVLEFDVSDRIKRTPVQEVYDQIFKDLEAAEKELVVNKPMASNSEFTTDAVDALRARIYLDMKEYDKAYEYAMKVINTKRYPLAPATHQAFEDMWVNDKSTEFILKLYISKESDEFPSGMGSFYGLDRDNRLFSPYYFPTQGLLDLYSESDLRKDVYFYKAPDVKVLSVEYKESVYIISKFKGNPAYATITNDPYYGIIPNGVHEPKVFRVAEQYLIAAEAAYFSGKDALTPLNALRVSRGLDPVKATGEALLKEIQDERTRELAFEGFRLWDLRRWNLPMNRMEPQKFDATSEVANYLTAPYYDLKIATTDPLYKKMIWPIPQREINVYGEKNMPQNPGW